MARPKKSPVKPDEPTGQGNVCLYTLEVFLLSGPIAEKFAKRNPAVSRTIEIRGNQTLEDLHHAIFDAFGRSDHHMYEFQFGTEPMDPKAPRYVLPGAFETDLGEENPPAGRVDRTRIDSLGLGVGRSFGYWFDFGDDWWHQINVEAIEDKIPTGKFPKVTKRVGKSPSQYLDEDESSGPGCSPWGQVIVAEEEKLKLGKGVAFVKSRLKRLPQSDETWEADFQALPQPMIQAETHYLGMVVGEGGRLLADVTVHGRPSVNDLATLLANAMRRPLDGSARRPNHVRLRGHRQWRESITALAELGVEVSVERKLTGISKAFRALLREMREERRAGAVKPSHEQEKVEVMFPAIATYVRGYGYVEIGDQEGFGFVVRAIGYGGLDFEDDTPETLAEAMAVLEAGLVRWFDEQGVELD